MDTNMKYYSIAHSHAWAVCRMYAVLINFSELQIYSHRGAAKKAIKTCCSLRLNNKGSYAAILPDYDGYY